LRPLAGGLILGLGLGLASAAEARMFSPTTFTLDNGLQVVVVENHRSPVVTQMVWYRVGSADEVAGKSGIAHFLEHLMFKGTHTIPVGQFSKIIARVGGHENAFTSTDYTAYYQSIASDQLDLAMKLESDRMHNLVLDEHNVETERAVVLEERRMRTDNNPAAQLNESMGAALFLNHPYHRPIIGWAQEIAGLNRQDALEFYGRWYAPNNAILVVAGDVDPEHVKELAQKWFGPIPQTEIGPRHRLVEPAQRAERLVTLTDPKVSQPRLVRQYLAPSAHYGDALMGPKESSAALEVLAEILGGGSSSRLHQAFVLNRKSATAAAAWYEATAWDYSSFGISIIPRGKTTLDQVTAQLDGLIATLLDRGVTAAELEKAKLRLTLGTAYERDSVQTGARILGAALASGQSIEDVENWPETIQAVTAQQVNEAAHRVLVKERSVTGRLLPDHRQGDGDQAPASSLVPPREER
jgi:zinc protease